MNRPLSVILILCGSLIISVGVVLYHDYFIVSSVAHAIQSAERCQRVERRAEALWRSEYYSAQEREPHRWQNIAGYRVHARVHPTTLEEDAAAWIQQRPMYLQRAEAQEP